MEKDKLNKLRNKETCELTYIVSLTPGEGNRKIRNFLYAELNIGIIQSIELKCLFSTVNKLKTIQIQTNRKRQVSQKALTVYA
jgi:hypothetical protein